jgi:ribosome-binding protein aMBF1 (putative translation factor)
MPAKRQTKKLAETFGAELRQARRTAGLTQQILAERAEVDPVFISFLENGHRQPSLTVLVSLERVLGLKSGELVARVTSSLSKSALGAGRNRETAGLKKSK